MNQEQISFIKLLPILEKITYKNFNTLFESCGKSFEKLAEYVCNIDPLEFSTNTLKAKVFSNSEAMEQIEQMNKKQIEVISINDNLYPSLLKKIQNPPVVLFLKGNKQLLQKKPCVGIVGARNANINSLKIAHELANTVSSRGYTVVSGFANGIDTAACKGAVQNQTIQVLANGVDVIYPKENENLYKDVLTNGGIFISQYRPSSTCQKWVGGVNFTNFPDRNRIISGLSECIVIVEANIKNEQTLQKNGITFLIGTKSGTLNTAHTSIKQGKKIFAVPSSLSFQSISGCNELIKRNLAQILTSYEDILSFLKSVESKSEQNNFLFEEDAQITYDNKIISNISHYKKKVYEAIPQDEFFAEDISLYLNLPIRVVLIILTEMEILDIITKTESGGFVKIV